VKNSRIQSQKKSKLKGYTDTYRTRIGDVRVIYEILWNLKKTRSLSLGENTTITNGAIIRGPTIIGNNSTIENDVYIGPYTSICNNTTINHGEIENSTIMDNCRARASSHHYDYTYMLSIMASGVNLTHRKKKGFQKSPEPQFNTATLIG
jgi:NDP-sugar pyrophosphorylase family protein